MKKNMSKTDMIMRMLIALIIALLYFTNFISGTTAIILGIIAIIFVITGLTGFCPLYSLFSFSTRKK